MSDTITLSWDWVIGTLLTGVIAFLAWIAKQISDIKNIHNQRIKFLELENSSKSTSIELLNKIVLKPFEKGVNKK